jgi:PAS domain S-box-containing protein
MPEQKKFIDRVIERLDRLDDRKVTGYLRSLAREKGLLENVFNSMREGLLVVDWQGKIVFLNYSASRLLGLPPESIGESVYSRIKHEGLTEIIRQGLQIPGQSLVRELNLIRPGAGWIRLSRSSWQDRDGTFRGIVLLLSDITRERKNDEDTQLMEKVGFLSRLTAVVAHELGNPLSSLSIHIQLIIRQLLKSGRRDLLRSARIIEEEIQRLHRIVEQFLVTLRPAPVQLSRSDLRVITGEVAALLKEELRGRGIDLIEKYPSQPLIGRLDPDLIRQVIMNLIRNAAQAMPRGGKIWLTLAADDIYLKLNVVDQGTGIPSESLSLVSEPFFTTKKGGSGLGLLVVYQIVRQHGGTVEIISRDGEGTTFNVRIPRQPDRVKLLPPPPAASGEKI